MVWCGFGAGAVGVFAAAESEVGEGFEEEESREGDGCADDERDPEHGCWDDAGVFESGWIGEDQVGADDGGGGGDSECGDDPSDGAVGDDGPCDLVGDPSSSASGEELQSSCFDHGQDPECDPDERDEHERDERDRNPGGWGARDQEDPGSERDDDRCDDDVEDGLFFGMDLAEADLIECAEWMCNRCDPCADQGDDALGLLPVRAFPEVGQGLGDRCAALGAGEGVVEVFDDVAAAFAEEGVLVFPWGWFRQWAPRFG